MIGKTINHYKILEKLGEGGMGVVYKAEDTKLKRMVALKFLPQSSSQNEEAKKRFINEARAASALDHPNICTLYEIGDAKDGQMYMAMAHYAGQTLKDKIADGPLPVEEAVDIAIQTARGLARAHEEEITHRDIKPANLIVTDRSEVKIVDFGLAKLAAVTKFTKSGMTMGTVSYMSPEQAQGISVDHRTDIWSLGVVLYEMLTGKQPFSGDYDQAVVYSLINEKHDPPSQTVKDLPRELETILEHALAKKTADRYQTAAEMLADLEVVSQNLEAVKSGHKPARLKVRRRPNLRRTLSASLVAGLVILALGVWFFFGREKMSQVQEVVSLAVLPLKGFGEEVSEDWFRDSMTDALITDLTKIGGMGVISQNSVMQYKDSPKSIPEIAQELAVEYVIDPSIVKVGEQVRLSVKLVQGATNKNIWAENYQRSFRDILLVQAEFAQSLAKQIQVQLTPAETRRFDQAQEIDPAVHEAYLKGRFHWHKRTTDGMQQSVEYFKQAIALDSTYAPAHAGLAQTYALMTLYALLPASDGYQLATTTATTALALDSTLADAHLALGFVGVMGDFYKSERKLERFFRKAIELSPSNADAHQYYGWYLFWFGRFNESRRALKRAERLNPLSTAIQNELGWLFLFERRYELAIEQYRKVLDLDPNFAQAHMNIGEALGYMGDFDRAIEATERGIVLEGRTPNYLGLLGRLYGRSGQKTKALEILDELNARADQGMDLSFFIARVYLGLGENDKALELLENVFLKRDPAIWLLNLLPLYDPIREHPKFKQWMEEIRLE